MPNNLVYDSFSNNLYGVIQTSNIRCMLNVKAGTNTFGMQYIATI